MHDPFPTEILESEFQIPKTKDDQVYDRKRYIYGNSPTTIYFPCKKLLFKIMKACIGIEDK